MITDWFIQHFICVVFVLFALWGDNKKVFVHSVKFRLFLLDMYISVIDSQIPK